MGKFGKVIFFLDFFGELELMNICLCDVKSVFLQRKSVVNKRRYGKYNSFRRVVLGLY